MRNSFSIRSTSYRLFLVLCQQSLSHTPAQNKLWCTIRFVLATHIPNQTSSQTTHLSLSTITLGFLSSNSTCWWRYGRSSIPHHLPCPPLLLLLLWNCLCRYWHGFGCRIGWGSLVLVVRVPYFDEYCTGCQAQLTVHYNLFCVGVDDTI